MDTGNVQIFRLYALDAFGQIIAGEHRKSASLGAAIEEGWQYVASQPSKWEHATGLEIWQGRQKLYASTTQDRACCLSSAFESV